MAHKHILSLIIVMSASHRPDTMMFIVNTDDTRRHPADHGGDEERNGTVWYVQGAGWPAQHHASIRQLNPPVPPGGHGPPELWAQRPGAPRHPEEKPAQETSFSAQGEHTWPVWRQLHRQVVENDLPHRVFLLQRSLLALLCPLKRSE